MGGRVCGGRTFFFFFLRRSNKNKAVSESACREAVRTVNKLWWRIAGHPHQKQVLVLSIISNSTINQDHASQRHYPITITVHQRLRHQHAKILNPRRSSFVPYGIVPRNTTKYSTSINSWPPSRPYLVPPTLQDYTSLRYKTERNFHVGTFGTTSPLFTDGAVRCMVVMKLARVTPPLVGSSSRPLRAAAGLRVAARAFGTRLELLHAGVEAPSASPAASATSSAWLWKT